ncbi:MAG: alpha/beta hydrolase [Oscillospiraceae bacterium]|nr:alpha/beta hydrolase [Oscillospiraceae bacterium]
MSFTDFIINAMFASSDKKRDAGLTIPEDVEYIRDLRYGGNAKYNTLHLTWPKGAGGRLPTLVSVHGGAYVYGTAELYSLYCASMAQRGFCVVNLNYRLAPDYTFPAPLEDINAAMDWLVKNADKYPVDPENVFFVGDSAGAQLASQYAAICTDREYQDIMGIYPPRFTLRALGLNCGMYDLKKSAFGSKYLASYFTKDPARFGEKLDVLSHIGPAYPPAYLFTAPGDFLLTECDPFAALLRSRGVHCEYRIYGDKNTGHVFHLNMRSDLARQANDDEAGFLMRYYRSSN